MSQIGCKVAIADPIKEEQDKEKKPLKIRCLLFFDGTLNNRDNIRERMRHEQGRTSTIYLKNRANQDKEAKLAGGALGVDLEDDSYENDFSNVVHLEGNVLPKQKGYDETVMTYIEGAGTIEYTPDYERDKDGNFVIDQYGNKKQIIGNNKDQQSGFAFAAGESGIKTKVDKGIEKAVAKIVHGPKTKERDNTNLYIEKLTIDIFGFSRGAASARYCVHRLLKAMDTGDRIEPYIEYRLRTMHWLEVKELEIRFVGLFDTVVSYMAAQAVKLGGSLENFLVKQTAIRHEKVKRVVHLASAEEHRDQFCLHNIKSAGGKGEEYFLPGVHSDIGGGYLDNGSDAGLKVCQASPYWAKKDRDEYLLALGWYKPGQLVEDVRWVDENTGNPSSIELSVLRDNRRARTVHNAYSRIPLKIMAEKATEDGIEFESMLDSDASQAINAFPELIKLESDLKRYMGKVGKRGSKPEDWQNAEPELNAIRHKHLHFSARYNGKYNGLGHNPRRSFFTQKRKRYVFNG